MRLLYYALRPIKACDRLKLKFIGNVSWRFVFKRLGHYLTHPRMLVRRIGRVNLKHRTIADWAIGIRFYLGRPRLIPHKIKQWLAGTNGAGSEVAPFTRPAANAQAQANTLATEALLTTGRNPRDIARAARIMEEALQLAHQPEMAIHLAAMRIRMNQNAAAKDVYDTAVRIHPDNRHLWYHVGVHYLRHGSREDVERFYGTVRAKAPGHALAEMVTRIYQRFPEYVEGVIEALSAPAGAQSGPFRRTFAITCAVWGDAYCDRFLKYTLASLLSPGNLPSLAQHRDVHVIIFTTPQSAERIRRSPQYAEASKSCRLHFEKYEPSFIAAAGSPDPEIADPAKFLLMSCAHYAAIEAGRRLNAEVMPIGGDNVFCGSFLTNAELVLRKDVCVIACPGYRLNGKVVTPLMEGAFRGYDGSLDIPPGRFDALLRDAMPSEYFIDSDHFSSFPLFLCWRTENQGMIVHCNHMMPYVIRCAHLRGPVDLSIDPVDGNFLNRHLVDPETIHLSDGAEFGAFDLADEPLIDGFHRRSDSFDVGHVALWLWCYADPLRKRYIRHPLCYGIDRDSETFDQFESGARSVVEQILTLLSNLESAAAHPASVGQPQAREVA